MQKNNLIAGGSKRAIYALFVFGAICLAYLFVTFHRVTPNVIAGDLTKELGFDPVSIGLMSSVFFFTFGLMQLPSGIFADILGPRKTVPAFFCLAGLASVWFGLSSALPLLVFTRALMGFGVSVVFVCGVKLITQWFPADKFASMNGIYLGMGGVGLILGSGPLAYLCSALGWRMAMIVTGVVTVAIAVVLVCIVYDRPEDKGFTPYQATPQAVKRSPFITMKKNVVLICSSWQFWLIAIWFCCHFSIHMAFGGVWGGPFLMNVHGMNRIEAGNVINMMGIGMLVGGPINGWLSDTIFCARRPVMLLNSILMLITFGSLYFWGEYFSTIACYLWFFCIAAFGMGALSLGFASMKDIFGAQATGTASGLLNAFPSFAVAIIQPITGAVLQNFSVNGVFTANGYSMASLIYIAMSILGLGAAFIAKEPMKAKQNF